MARELPIFEPNPAHAHAPASAISIPMGGGPFTPAADGTRPLRRHPDWIKSRMSSGDNYHDLKGLLRGLNLNTVTFLLLTQVIIFILGWPLEWSEIIIIFVPIFLPLLPHFGVDPIFFGILVALNLQTSFLTPPMAMSAYYLKGVAPKEVLLSTIFKGCLPFVSMVFVAMAAMYIFPSVVFYLPDLLYGNR